MPISDAIVSETKAPSLSCPLCGTSLPAGATACDRCDWVEGYHIHQSRGSTRDIIAVALSLVPGLGHIYKGHKFAGWIIMAGTVLVLFGVGVVATYTAGFGLLLLPFYWLWVMTLAYWIEDRAAVRK